MGLCVGRVRIVFIHSLASLANHSSYARKKINEAGGVVKIVA